MIDMAVFKQLQQAITQMLPDASYTIYRNPVALHLLSLELLLVWFPSGKLMHAFLAPAVATRSR